MSSKKHAPKLMFEHVTTWVGSISSLIVHTIFFATSFTVGFIGIVSWDTVLLVLTTIVSLEAIYLAIFIQMSVNRNSESLREVEENVDEIQEDVDEIQEDIEDLGEEVKELGQDVEEIHDDIEELSEEETKDEERKRQQASTLEDLTKNIHKLLADLETLKKQK